MSKERKRINLSKITVPNLKSSFNGKEESKICTRERETETIRCSSQFQTEENLRSKEIKESKKRWVSNTEFKRFFGKVKSKSLISNLTSQSPYLSPSSHQFRDKNKEKWINQKNFYII